MGKDEGEGRMPTRLERLGYMLQWTLYFIDCLHWVTSGDIGDIHNGSLINKYVEGLCGPVRGHLVAPSGDTHHYPPHPLAPNEVGPPKGGR